MIRNTEGMKILYLNLKGKYFDQIESGEKTREYRLCSPFWSKRLIDKNGRFKEWDLIVIRRGYPKKGRIDLELIRPWKGVTVEKITHEHFGSEEVSVFSIVVN